MEVFYHHIYEFEKGLRNLILHTTRVENEDIVEMKLRKKNIPFMIYDIGNGKINIFFGHKYCIDVIKSIGKKDLTFYTDEEDFILGTMLGYDRTQQCERYLKRKFAREIVDTLVG